MKPDVRLADRGQSRSAAQRGDSPDGAAQGRGHRHRCLRVAARRDGGAGQRIPDWAGHSLLARPSAPGTRYCSRSPRPTQAALRDLEWVHRRENLVVCGPAGNSKTFFLEALGQRCDRRRRRRRSRDVARLCDRARKKRRLAWQSNAASPDRECQNPCRENLTWVFILAVAFYLLMVRLFGWLALLARSFGTPEKKLGIKGSPARTVILEDVRIPANCSSSVLIAFAQSCLSATVPVSRRIEPPTGTGSLAQADQVRSGRRHVGDLCRRCG